MFISNADLTNRDAEHRNVVDTAVRAGVGRVVYTSVVAIDEAHPLAASHLATETQIVDSGLA